MPSSRLSVFTVRLTLTEAYNILALRHFSRDFCGDPLYLCATSKGVRKDPNTARISSKPKMR
jgi:hypothetical protein